jgi:hypothetical protein
MIERAGLCLNSNNAVVGSSPNWYKCDSNDPDQGHKVDGNLIYKGNLRLDIGAGNDMRVSYVDTKEVSGREKTWNVGSPKDLYEAVKTPRQFFTLSNFAWFAGTMAVSCIAEYNGIKIPLITGASYDNCVQNHEYISLKISPQEAISVLDPRSIPTCEIDESDLVYNSKIGRLFENKTGWKFRQAYYHYGSWVLGFDNQK